MNQFPAANVGYPDVCYTVISFTVVLVPYPNVANESTGFPAPLYIIVGGAPVHNLCTILPFSLGDLPGVFGVCSGTVLGLCQTFANNAYCTLMGALPVKRMSSTGLSNIINGFVVAAIPPQLKVLIYSR